MRIQIWRHAARPWIRSAEVRGTSLWELEQNNKTLCAYSGILILGAIRVNLEISYNHNA